jgi:Tfp pilus assembly protein PilX
MRLSEKRDESFIPVPILRKESGMVTLADIKLMRKAGHRTGEAGSALLASVLVITLITGAGLSAMTTTASSQGKAQNLMNEKQAFYLAEAGIQHGRLLLYNQYNANPNIWTAPPPTGYNTTTPQTLVPTTSLNGVGSYTVTIQDASGNGLLMTATGTASNNATTSISSLVVRGWPNDYRAVIVGGDLTISSDPKIEGSSGGVHANKTLTISGDPWIQTSATGTQAYVYIDDYDAAVPYVGTYAGTAGQMSINAVRASDYYGTRDYLLNSNGLVYNATRNKLTTSPVTWNCWTPRPNWSYSSKRGNYISSYWWELTCSTTVNGTFYVGRDVVLSADAGTSDNPWIATIIATGSIKVTSNNLYMRAPNQATDGALFKKKTENMIFLANTDVLLQGTANQHFTGITRAREQVGISGNPIYTGYIIAQDAANSVPLVGSNFISGNAQIKYTGFMLNGNAGTVIVQSTMY